MEDWLEHYRRWNIEYDLQASFEQFRYRLINLLKKFRIHFTADEARQFNYYVGREVLEAYPGNFVELFYPFERASSIIDLFTMLQATFRVLEESTNLEVSEELYQILTLCLKDSANINLNMSRIENSVILYPKGAALLDSGIINQSLSWLSTHPVVLEHFSGALRRYMELADKDEESQRSLRDELRFSVEQLLKEILGNNKNLPNQAEPLEAWMKQKGSNPQVVGLYKNLLFGRYKLYQDDVKHSGTYDPQDLEFMIYLTGTFIRQLLQLERAPD